MAKDWAASTPCVPRSTRTCRSRVSCFFLRSPSTALSSGTFWTLKLCGTLVLSSELSAEAAISAIEQQQVNCFLAVPSLYAALIESLKGSTGARLRTVILAGEAIPPDLVNQHHQDFPDVALVNEYGPTECSVWSTAHHCTEDDRLGTIVPIGRPLPNYRAYVLDDFLEPVPAGVIGESLTSRGLVLRGAIANCSGLTAERFVADPHGVAGGVMCTATGRSGAGASMGCWTSSGGPMRRSSLARFRIEPGEIETSADAAGRCRRPRWWCARMWRKCG